VLTVAKARAKRADQDLAKYVQMATEAGAPGAKVVATEHVYCADWVRLKCQYGCGGYGRRLSCPPYSPTPETTRRVVSEFRRALLIHGDEHTDVSRIAGDIEREAFLDGFYRAFSFHSGPCNFCSSCDPAKPCNNPSRARPAMEASGIDVFATARAAGFPIEVVRDEGCRQNYYSLVLID
jgi:predicted metal-binding protein